MALFAFFAPYFYDKNIRPYCARTIYDGIRRSFILYMSREVIYRQCLARIFFSFFFTARPKAQRCQVTPYVVNVGAAAAAAAGEGSDS